MRKLIFLIVLLPFIGIGQTPELEKQSLTKRFQNGDFNQETYLNYATEWRDLIDQFGGYPELPVNIKTGDIEFKFLIEYPTTNKKIIFDRVLEWSAINFGEIDKVLKYENYDNGKIILKGNFIVMHKKDYNFMFFESKEYVEKRCFETYIFTIKDNKMKIEITDLIYKYTMGGYSYGNTYIPISKMELPIKYYYPITNAKPKFWSEHLDLLYQTKLETDNLVKSLEQYISNNENDYNF